MEKKSGGKIGSLKLMYGDLLLLLIGQDSHKKIANTKDFYVVSDIDIPEDLRSPKKKSFIYIATIIVGLGLLNIISLIMTLLLLFLALVLLKLLSSHTIKKSIDLDLLIVLSGSITIGKSSYGTQVPRISYRTGFTILLSPFGVKGLLIGVFIFTMILTSFISNIAAISIAFPIVHSITQGIDVDATGFYVAIAFAASGAFISPVGYQTNLMVCGPGQYTFKDFFRIGFPLSIIYASICIVYIVYKYNIA